MCGRSLCRVQEAAFLFLPLQISDRLDDHHPGQLFRKPIQSFLLTLPALSRSYRLQPRQDAFHLLSTMADLDFRTVLNPLTRPVLRLPSLLKRRSHVPPRELEIIHLHLEPDYNPAYTPGPPVITEVVGFYRDPHIPRAPPPTPPPQLNDIALDFSETKIDDDIPHLPSDLEQACYCCGETKPSWQFPPSVTNRCEHAVMMCRTCLANWIESCLRSGGFEKINCAQCHNTLNAEEVERGATAEVYKR